MYCSKCDKKVITEVDDGIVYCKECGMKLFAEVIQQTRLQTDSSRHVQVRNRLQIYTLHKANKINAFQNRLYSDDKFSFIPPTTKEFIVELYKFVTRNNNIFTHYDEIIVYYFYYLSQFEKQANPEDRWHTRQEIFDKHRFNDNFPRLYVPDRYREKYDVLEGQRLRLWNNKVINRKVRRLYAVFKENGYRFRELSIVPSRVLLYKCED